MPVANSRIHAKDFMASYDIMETKNQWFTKNHDSPTHSQQLSSDHITDRAMQNLILAVTKGTTSVQLSQEWTFTFDMSSLSNNMIQLFVLSNRRQLLKEEPFYLLCDGGSKF